MKSYWVFFCVVSIFLGIVAWAGVSKPVISGSNESGKPDESGLDTGQRDIAGNEVVNKGPAEPIKTEDPAVQKNNDPDGKEDVSAKNPAEIQPEAGQAPEIDVKPVQEAASNVVATQIKVSDMKNSADPLLRKMAEYEEKCGPVFLRMMIFEYMPVSSGEAQDMAADMAARLKNFAAAGIVPVVSVEPVDSDGEPLNFSDISAGVYDIALKKYFSVLKNSGINDGQMGMWVPLPEPNLDEWGDANHSPADFAAAFNRYGKIFKQEFGTAKLSVLIDNETYRANVDDTELVSLAPFVTGLDKQLIDSFGLQGYPWAAPADEDPDTYHDYDASSFLNSQRAIEAARIIGVDTIWFSTGTFLEMFAGQAGKSVKADMATRKKMLDGIIAQANKARAAGFETMILIFAQDKSDTEEATDFSYWNENGSKSGGEEMLCAFVKAASSQNIELGVYDSY